MQSIVQLMVEALVVRQRVPLEVQTERDGGRALRRVQEESFDVIISDYRMPGATGFQVLAASRDKSPHAIRILITGYNDLPEDASAERAAPHRVFKKPFERGELRVLIEMTLQKHRGGL